MTGRSKPLSPQQALELVAEVSASDREKARAAISQGVQVAEAQWIEANLIAEALTAELIGIARQTQTNARVAAYLRDMAEVIEARTDLH